MTLREFKRRTNKWDNSMELTFGFRGEIYDIVEFCGYKESCKDGEGRKREIICFLAEPNGQG